jgi:hypothetical protein
MRRSQYCVQGGRRSVKTGAACGNRRLPLILKFLKYKEIFMKINDLTKIGFFFIIDKYDKEAIHHYYGSICNRHCFGLAHKQAFVVQT